MTEGHLVFQTTSYNGRLDFIHYFDGPSDGSSTQGVSPLVVVRGNGFELHGDITGLEPNHAESFSVQLHEVRGFRAVKQEGEGGCWGGRGGGDGNPLVVVRGNSFELHAW